MPRKPQQIEQLAQRRVRVERGVQIERLAYNQIVLELAFLQLHADPLVPAGAGRQRVQAEGSAPSRGIACAGHNMHSTAVVCPPRSGQEAERSHPCRRENEMSSKNAMTPVTLEVSPGLVTAVIMRLALLGRPVGALAKLSPRTSQADRCGGKVCHAGRRRPGGKYGTRGIHHS